MAIITIAPLKTERVIADYQWFNIFTSTHSFNFSSPASGLGQFTIRGGRSYNVEKYSTIDLTNTSIDTPLVIDYEMSPLQAVSQSVDIANTPSILRIIEPIAVTATATINGGSVIVNSPTMFNALLDKSIAPGVSSLLVAANVNRREVIINNLSITGSLRIAGINAAANRGLLLDKGGSLVLTTTAAIYAFNTGVAATSISVVESVH